MKKFILPVAAATLVALFLAFPAVGGAIKTWTTETLTYADLNATFEHIHNNMVGGHGARLVNADVSTSAAIAHSKLATPALVPKAWVAVISTCTASPCTISASSGVSSVARTGTGLYRVTFSTARTNTSYAPRATGIVADVSTTASLCSVGSITTTTFDIGCRSAAGALADSGLVIDIYDNDN